MKTRIVNGLVRVAALAVPRTYRQEVVTDLRDQQLSLGGLLRAVVRSGWDARRQGPPVRWGGWGTDLSGAWRTHRARPGSAVLIVVILGLALGLNTAIYSMVDAVLVRPLPLRDPGGLAFVWNQSPRLDREPLAPARALDFRARVSAFDQAALIGHISMTVTGRGAAQRWFGTSVSSNFFDVLGASPAAGRTFHAEDTDRDVVVLSHTLWRDQFGADPSVVGTSVVMNGRPRTVVGIMGADFFWPSITSESTADQPPLFWACAPPPDVPEQPVKFDEDIALNRHSGVLRMVARLAPGRTLTAAAEETSAVATELGREFPETDGGRSVVLVTARDQLFGSTGQPLWFVLLASVMVVIGACVNVAGLLVVRQAGRRREFAVRSALGAGRLRLVRQLMLEAAVLASAGGALGLVVALAGLQVLVAMAPTAIGRLDHASISANVLLWTGTTTLLTAVLLGGISALTLWRDRSADDLRGVGTGERGRGRLRQAIVAAEVALAVALLVGAALFGESLLRLQRVDVGFDPHHLLTFDVMVTGERAEYQAQQLELFDGLLERIRALPGVQSAGGAVTLPIGGDDFGAGAFVEGRPLPPPGTDRRVGYQIVGTNWFSTLGMRVTQGRDFDVTDTRATRPVVIINETLAALEWPGESPVGQRLRYSRNPEAPLLTVVGVVSDIRHLGPAAPPRPELYLPYSQSSMPMMAMAVRTAGDPLSLVPAIRAEAADLDSTQPISGISTMEAHLDQAYGRSRFLARLTLMFGAAVGVLALIGVYGVTSFAVAQRTREFAVMTALGASPARLSRGVLTNSLVPVAWGAGVGVAIAAWASRLIAALLFGTAPMDVVAYVTAVVVLLVTAVIASLVPARRAASIDPVVALRDG